MVEQTGGIVEVFKDKEKKDYSSHILRELRKLAVYAANEGRDVVADAYTAVADSAIDGNPELRDDYLAADYDAALKDQEAIKVRGQLEGIIPVLKKMADESAIGSFSYAADVFRQALQTLPDETRQSLLHIIDDVFPHR